MSAEQQIQDSVLKAMRPGLHSDEERAYAQRVIQWVFGHPIPAPSISSEVDEMIVSTIVKAIGSEYGSIVMPDYVVIHLQHLSMSTSR